MAKQFRDFESARKFAKKLGMSLHDAELISWLVLNHLEMSVCYTHLTLPTNREV